MLKIAQELLVHESPYFIPGQNVGSHRVITTWLLVCWTLTVSIVNILRVVKTSTSVLNHFTPFLADVLFSFLVLREVGSCPQSTAVTGTLVVHKEVMETYGLLALALRNQNLSNWYSREKLQVQLYISNLRFAK